MVYADFNIVSTLPCGDTNRYVIIDDQSSWARAGIFCTYNTPKTLSRMPES